MGIPWAQEKVEVVRFPLAGSQEREGNRERSARQNSDEKYEQSQAKENFGTLVFPGVTTVVAIR